LLGSGNSVRSAPQREEREQSLCAERHEDPAPGDRDLESPQQTDMHTSTGAFTH
jgi:hypothetical protein